MAASLLFAHNLAAIKTVVIEDEIVALMGHGIYRTVRCST
jgi:hypothetical protein